MGMGCTALDSHNYYNMLLNNYNNNGIISNMEEKTA